MIQLPTTCFAEDEGALVNSGRWLQWHWAGGTPPGEAKTDTWIMAQIHLRLKDLYRKEGGAFPDPILNLHWPYKDPGDPTPEELTKEMNGYVVADVPDPNDPTKKLLEAGKQIASFALLRDDGTTASGSWIFAGSFTEEGNMMARRDNSDPGDSGAYLKWAFAWPANRRILYNRASADIDGKPWDPSRKLIEWDGQKWTGYDVPDIAPNAKPHEVGPFIMNAEGVGRLFVRGLMRDGPFPVHYEPFESPVANVMAPAVRGNPVARVFADDFAQFADVGLAGIPLCGHLLPADRAFPLLDQEQPGELGPAAGILRRDLGGARRRRRASSRAAGCGCGRSAARSSPRRWSPSGSSR